MAEIRDTYSLEIDDALRQIDEVGRRLDRALDTDFNLDFRGFDRLSSSLTDAERSAEGLQAATGNTADAAGRSERSYAGLATALGTSESRAAALASEAREAALSASDIEREARQIADSMGLSENEARRFTAALRGADNQAERVERSTDRIGTSFGRIRGIALSAIGGFLGFQAVEGIVRGASTAVGAYADSVEEASKAATVFGSSFAAIEDFVAGSVDSLRASRTEALQATGAFGAFFTGLGFGQSQAADLSQEVVQLGADIGSFNNLDFTEALDKLRAGLAGEVEPLRQLGAGFNAAEVSAKALELGLVGVGDELSEQDKVLARLALITERTATAQGDVARTSDTLAARVRAVRAEFADLVPTIGEALLPAVESLLDAAPDIISSLGELAPIVGDLAESFADAAPSIAEGAIQLIGFAQSGVDSLRIIGSVTQGIDRLRGAAFDALGALADRLNIFGEIETEFPDFGQIINDSFTNLDVSLAIQDINASLQAGVDNVDAFGVVVADLASKSDLTAAAVEALADAASLDQLDSTAIDSLAQGFGNLEQSIGSANLDLILQQLGRIQLSFIDTNSGANQFSNSLLGLNQIAATGIDPLASLADEAEATVSGLAGLRQQAEDSGDGLLGLATDAATAGANLLAGLDGVEQIDGALQLLAESSEGAAARYRDSFDVILTETNKAGEEVPRSIEAIVTDFEEQAQRLTDFQATIATLALSGFDDLAASLQQEGPGALETGLSFLDDIDAASRAERALEGQGVEISDSLESDLNAAISDADFAAIGTDVGLGIVAGLTSPAVLSAISAGAAQVGQSLEDRIKKQLEVQSPSRVMMRIGEFAGLGLIQGFTATANRRVPALTGVELPGFAGGAGGRGGGATTNNVTVTNSVQLAESDARFAAAIHAQQTASVGSALRGFSAGSIRV